MLSKEYDGGTAITNATLSGGEVSGEAGTESLTLKVTGGSYASADVGANITISDAEFGLEAGANTDKGNYRLPSSITLTGRITAKALTIGDSVVLTKAYDGGAAASGASVKSGGAVTGEVGSESFALAVSGGTYPQSAVGSGLTISSPTFTLSASGGAKTGNYSYTLPSEATGDITKAEITDVDGVTVKTRPVDGTTTATFVTTAATGTGVVSAELAGFRAGLTVSGTFPDGAKTTAGTYNVAVTYSLGDSGGFKTKNYTLSDAGDTLRGTVTNKRVLVLSPTATGREYGQTDPAQWEYTVAAKSGSAFASGHGASTTFFTSSPLTRASGDDVGKYAFSLVGSPSYETGMEALYTFEVKTGAKYTITKKALSISTPVVLTKAYDGSRAATGASVKSGGAVTGEVGAESFALAVSGGTYPQSDVGAGLTISSPTFTLSASGGAKTGNYSYTLPSEATGDITKAEITDVDGVTVKTRPVDGTTTATFVTTAATGTGVVSAELAGFRAGLTVSGAFPDGAKTTAGTYNVAVTYELGDGTGFKKSNYTLSDSGDTLRGTVTSKRVLVLTPTATGRVYGQTDPAQWEYTVAAKSGSAFASGHSASTTFFTSSPLTRDAGDDVGQYAFKLVSSPQYAAGMEALYAFEVASGAKYTITKKALSISTPVVLTKAYDGGAGGERGEREERRRGDRRGGRGELRAGGERRHVPAERRGRGADDRQPDVHVERERRSEDGKLQLHAAGGGDREHHEGRDHGRGRGDCGESSGGRDDDGEVRQDGGQWNRRGERGAGRVPCGTDGERDVPGRCEDDGGHLQRGGDLFPGRLGRVQDEELHAERQRGHAARDGDEQACAGAESDGDGAGVRADRSGAVGVHGGGEERQRVCVGAHGGHDVLHQQPADASERQRRWGLRVQPGERAGLRDRDRGAVRVRGGVRGEVHDHEEGADDRDAGGADQGIRRWHGGKWREREERRSGDRRGGLGELRADGERRHVPAERRGHGADDHEPDVHAERERRSEDGQLQLHAADECDRRHHEGRDHGRERGDGGESSGGRDDDGDVRQDGGHGRGRGDGGSWRGSERD